MGDTFADLGVIAYFVAAPAVFGAAILLVGVLVAMRRRGHPLGEEAWLHGAVDLVGTALAGRLSLYILAAGWILGECAFVAGGGSPLGRAAIQGRLLALAANGLVSLGPGP